MKKRYLVLAIAFALMIFTGCEKTADAADLLADIDLLCEEIIGVSQDKVYELIGEPAGSLSGFWGDVYYNASGQAVLIYYDEHGNVALVKMAD